MPGEKPVAFSFRSTGRAPLASTKLNSKYRMSRYNSNWALQNQHKLCHKTITLQLRPTHHCQQCCTGGGTQAQPKPGPGFCPSHTEAQTWNQSSGSQLPHQHYTPQKALPTLVIITHCSRPLLTANRIVTALASHSPCELRLGVCQARCRLRCAALPFPFPRLWEALSSPTDPRFQAEFSHAIVPQNSCALHIFSKTPLDQYVWFSTDSTLAHVSRPGSFPAFLLICLAVVEGKRDTRWSLEDGSSESKSCFAYLEVYKADSEREKTEKGVSVSSWDNENKAGTMPSTGWLPKHISLAWTSYKQGNEKHMLESKVRSEGLWVSDSRPKTFPLFFSCGPMVSNVTVTALISHDGRAYFGLVGFCCVFFFPLP